MDNAHKIIKILAYGILELETSLEKLLSMPPEAAMKRLRKNMPIITNSETRRLLAILGDENVKQDDFNRAIIDFGSTIDL